MTLNEMRSKFTEVTGRYDLNDSQVDFYLNAGVRKLNRAVEGEQFIKEESYTLESYYLDIDDSLSVLEVYLVDGTGRRRIHRMVFRNFISVFPNFESATGVPVAWTTETHTASGNGKRVLFNSASIGTSVIVRYKEDSTFDTTDGTSNTWWSVHYPEALIYASAFVLESFYRNSEGMRDWLNALQSVLDDVEFEFMSNNFHENMQMSEYGL